MVQNSEGQTGVQEDTENAMSCTYCKKLANTSLKQVVCWVIRHSFTCISGDGVSKLEDGAFLIPFGKRFWEAVNQNWKGIK